MFKNIKIRIRYLIRSLTGFWIHKKKYLPTGVDLFLDLEGLNNHNFKIVFDVGANVGQTAVKYAINFPEAEIYSFEPVNASFIELKKKTSHLKQVKCFNLAFGKRKETKDILLNINPTCVKNSLKTGLKDSKTSNKVQKVTVDTVDNFVRINNIESIDLLKIDTEGWEIEVLEGAAQLMNNNRIKFVLSEVGFTNENERNTPFHLLNDFLNENNFIFYGLYEVSHVQIKKYTHYGNALFINKKYLQECHIST